MRIEQGIPYFTVEEASKITKYHTTTLYRKLKSGEIQGTKIGGMWHIPIDEIIRLLHTPITVKACGREFKISPEAAATILRFYRKCIESGNTIGRPCLPQARTQMFGFTTNWQLQLVCWGCSAEVATIYVKDREVQDLAYCLVHIEKRHSSAPFEVIKQEALKKIEEILRRAL